MKAIIFRQVKVWPLAIVILFVWVMDAVADIQLTDNLSMTGFVRYELAVHTASGNPNNDQDDNNAINLSRAFFQTEWTYRPSDVFKLYGKARFIHDSTEQLDSELNEYDAFPLSTPRYGTYLRANNDDDFAAELWELYADVSVGNLWMRLGKQQIVWGEMISGRIMDIINPLDWSWHFQFEPEEFENIRVPQWSIRAMYNVEQLVIPWLKDMYIEGFLNPGDISPRIFPEPGSPYNLKPAPPPIYNTTEKDRRGDQEFGFRVAGRVGQFFGTLNYLHLYSKTGYLEDVGPPGPPPFNVENRYPSTNVYGMTLNYAFDAPINMTVTFEGTYTPDQPYADALAADGGHIREVGTWKHAIRFDRKTFVFPRPTDAMMIQLQYSQTVVEDEDKIKSTGAPFSRDNRIDKTKDVVALLFSQNFWHNNIATSLKLIYDLDGCEYITPGFKYRHGDYWYFDVYGVILGGSEKRPGSFGSLDYASEIFGRITFQF